MEETSWILQLVDQVSGPARAINASLKSVSSTAQGVQRSTAAMGAPKGLTQSYQGAFASIQSGASEATGSIGGLNSALAGIVGGLSAAALASSAFSALIGAAKTLATSALSAVAFKENSLIAFEVMLKSKKKATEIFKEAQQFAAKTPFKTEDVVSLYQGLVTAGFSIEKNAAGFSEVAVLATAIGDAAAAQGMSPQAISSITNQISQIKSMGKLRSAELTILSQWGIGRDAVLTEIAKSLGKSKAQVTKMLESGQIDAQTGIYAIVSAINKNQGGLMAKTADSLTGLWSTLESIPSDILSQLYDTGTFDDLKKFAKSIAAAFDPNGPAGKSIASFTSDIMKGFLDFVLGPFKDAQGQITPESIGAGIDQIKVYVMDLWDGLKGFYEDAKAIWAGLSTVFGIANWIADAKTSIFTGAYGLGVSIVEGLISGIKSVAGLVNNNVVDVVGGGYNAAKDFLGIKSPSRKFMELGRFTGEGFQLGLGKATDGISIAAEGLGSAALFTPPRPDLGALGTTNNNAGGVTVNLTVNGGGDPEAIKKSVVAALSEAFEGIGFELGVSPQ